MTRTQIKKQLQRINEILVEAQEIMDELTNDVEIAIDEIEPYENRSELTQAQEERQEWLEEALDAITTNANSLTDIIDELAYYIV